MASKMKLGREYYGSRGEVKYMKFTGELCSWTRFSLAEILVLAGTADAGGMTHRYTVL